MKILNFPQYRQSKKFSCGACALRSVLAYYDIEVSEEEVMRMAGTNESGTMPSGIKATVGHFGLEQKSGQMTTEDIKNYLDKDIPVIMAIQAWADRPIDDWANHWDDGHYVVAIGYDDEKIYFEDPASDARLSLSFVELEDRWHDVDSAGKKYDHWGMAVFKKML